VSFNPGFILNAIVVNRIATHDGRGAANPDLADRLHDSGARQPFTLSPLRDLPSAHPDEDGYRLRAGHSARAASQNL